jgi:hypothetical protein
MGVILRETHGVYVACRYRGTGRLPVGRLGARVGKAQPNPPWREANAIVPSGGQSTHRGEADLLLADSIS